MIQTTISGQIDQPVPVLNAPFAQPSMARSSRFRRILLTPFRVILRRPARSLAVLTLIAIIGLAVGSLIFFAWTNHELNLARRAVERGHNLEAIPHLQICHRYRPDHPELLLLSARVARRSGAWTEADLLLNRYSELHGDDDDLVLERLLFRATQGELEAVEPLLQSRIDRDDPSAPLAREALIAGMLYRYLLREAEQAIEAWLQRNPDQTLALMAKSRLLEQRELNSEATLIDRRILELDPEFDEVRLRLTRNILQLSQGEEALNHLQYLHRRLPDHMEVSVQLAQALDATGQSDQAIPLLDECLRRDPEHSGALAERGRIARQHGDLDLAERDLGLAIRIDPGNSAAHHQYYLTLVANGKHAEAAKEQEAIGQIQSDLTNIRQILLVRLQEHPDDSQAYFDVAMIALRAGRPKEAMRWLQNGMKINPNHAPTHRVLAAIYHEMGDPILAAKHRAIAQKLSAK